MKTARIGGSVLPSSSPQILEPIVTPKGTLQVREVFDMDTHALFIDKRCVAMHPNGFSCRSLAERIASGDEERVRKQAQYLLDCGGMTIAVDALVWYAAPEPRLGLLLRAAHDLQEPRTEARMIDPARLKAQVLRRIAADASWDAGRANRFAVECSRASDMEAARLHEFDAEGFRLTARVANDELRRRGEALA